MQTKIVLKRSQQENIMWHFFVVLDHVSEDALGREEFAREMLAAFDADPAEVAAWVPAICRSLPEKVHDLDGKQILGALEQALPIEWLEDVYQLSLEQTAELERAFLAILAARRPEQLPREVTGLVMAEVQRVAGTHLEQELLPDAARAIEEQLISSLWRSKDAASQRKLTAHLLFGLKSTAHLEISRPAASPHDENEDEDEDEG